MSESGNAAPSDPSAPVDGHEELQVCPPGGAFVTLSEALSWIAFRVSVGCDALSVRLGEDTHAATDGHRLLRTALDALLNDGRSGRIPLVGKYIASSNVHIATVLPDTIDPIRLLAFARFNILRDGLEFGTGLTWHHYDGQMMLARPQNERRDYFHSVQVSRAELMSFYPAAVTDPKQTAEPPAKLPSDDAILAKMLELVGNGMKRDDAARDIHGIPGFEAVGNDLARRVVNGKLPRGRRKKARK